MQSRGYRYVELGREAGDWNPGCSKTSLFICQKKMIDWILDLVAFNDSKFSFFNITFGKRLCVEDQRKNSGGWNRNEKKKMIEIQKNCWYYEWEVVVETKKVFTLALVMWWGIHRKIPLYKRCVLESLGLTSSLWKGYNENKCQLSVIVHNNLSDYHVRLLFINTLLYK